MFVRCIIVEEKRERNNYAACILLTRNISCLARGLAQVLRRVARRRVLVARFRARSVGWQEVRLLADVDAGIVSHKHFRCAPVRYARKPVRGPNARRAAFGKTGTTSNSSASFVSRAQHF